METKKPGERGEKGKGGEGAGGKGLVYLTALQTKKSWSYVFRVRFSGDADIPFTSQVLCQFREG